MDKSEACFALIHLSPFTNLIFTQIFSLPFLFFSFVSPTQALDEVHHAGFIPAHCCAIHSGGVVYLIQFSKPHMALSIIPVMAGPSPVRHLPHTVTSQCELKQKSQKIV